MLTWKNCKSLAFWILHRIFTEAIHILSLRPNHHRDQRLYIRMQHVRGFQGHGNMHEPGTTVEFAWKKNLGFVVRCTPDPDPFGGFHKALAKQRKESRGGKKQETRAANRKMQPNKWMVKQPAVGCRALREFRFKGHCLHNKP